jgi:hypothetical protein
MNRLTFEPAPPALHDGLPAGVLLLMAGSWHDAAGHSPGEHCGYHLEHRPTAEPARSTLEVLREPGVAAATAYQPGAGRLAWLALRFAVDLGDYRLAHAIPVVPCMTSAARPAPVPTGTVRIPHLAGVADPPGQVTDCVIWEIMTAGDAVAWLGQPLPDQAWFEGSLPELLALRKRLREHALPEERNCATLTALLTGRRYLSIRFAYQNPALIAGAFAAIEGDRSPTHVLDD